MGTVSVVLCLIVTVIVSIWYFFKKRYSYWKDRGVPYVEPRIPLGNLPLRNGAVLDLTVPIYKKKQPGFPFMGAYFIVNPFVIPTDLDFVQNVLVKDFSSFHERGIYVNEEDDPLSGHLFALDGEKWKTVRSKLSPTFTSGKMKFMFPTVIEVANRFHAVLAQIVGVKCEVEMKDMLARFTTDVIGTCAFGIECNSLKDPGSEFRRFGQKVQTQPAHGPIVQFLMVQYPNLAKKLHLKTMSNDVIEFFMHTVRETVEYREKHNVRRNDFMDLLIQMKANEPLGDHSLGSLSLGEMAAQVFVFFLAGFETSASTIMFCLYELALNPEIQEKARQEIGNVLSNHNGDLTYEAIKDMVYVNQVLSETLRKYPAVVHLIRRATRDYQVSNTSLIIEKGTGVFIPTYAIHHDPEIFPKPEVFDPERFTSEEIKKRHPMAFLGFGDGPRNCIGMRFGKMQSMIGLITLLKNFRFKPSVNTTIPIVFSEFTPVLTAKFGMHLEVEKI